MIDSTLNQMSESSRRTDDRRGDSYGRESDVDNLIHKIFRDVEEIRINKRELNDCISDLEVKFNRLRDLLRNKRY